MININSFIDFIKGATTSYHTVASMEAELASAGYKRLFERESWELVPGGKYYTVRGGSIIAFRYRTAAKSMNIVSAHSDFPALKLKAVPDTHGKYTKLNVETYGGAIHYTWFDRPLSLAGRVAVKTENGIDLMLVDLDEDIAVIPSVAPHLNRQVNTSFAPNAAIDLQPLYAAADAGSVLDKVASKLGVSAADILSHDLYLYNRDSGRLFGEKGEFILAPRIDNLASVYTALRAFIDADDTVSMPIIAVFDNEEVGSSTAEGAASDFLADTVKRLFSDDVAFRAALASSLVVSADGAHAIHPNHPELSDQHCYPVMGCGVAVKYNANRRYATDALSDGALRLIASTRDIPLQSYSNRPDLLGGSTLGSISSTRLPVSTVDIGVPQLAMHSACECAAVSDIKGMAELLLAFYESELPRLFD